MVESETKGLVIVFFGEGKGKTSAALGTALRALGHGLKVLILQFVKGDWPYGELEAAKRLAPGLEIRQLGKGCYGILGDDLPKEEHLLAARQGLEVARREIGGGGWDVVVLDEVSLVVEFGFVEPEELLDCIRSKPPHVHLVLTGRQAHHKIIETADLVSEVRKVKHPFDEGLTAQKGIEF
jgi:cob(I)alamin adenosyltransferase